MRGRPSTRARSTPRGTGRALRPGSTREPETNLLSAELRSHLLDAVDRLAPAQRAVITLRDLVGLSADEVCDMLELTEVNQRVLLHRARSRVRTALLPLVEVAR